MSVLLLISDLLHQMNLNNKLLTDVSIHKFYLVSTKPANLIRKLNFYKLIPYPMDNCLSGRHRPARQMPEKDVLCFHRLAGPSTVHSPDGASYFLPV